MESSNNNLTPKEQYDLKKGEKEQGKRTEHNLGKAKEVPKKIGKYLINILIIVIVIAGIGWLLSLIPNSPPTSAENHIEESPAAHIMTTRIPDAIQRHMLEHADGGGPSSIIIQYNCDDYECESDLVQKLTTLVEEYPANVYLAPNKYDGKIILTVIRDFIE